MLSFSWPIYMEYELCKSNGLKFNEQLNNDGASPLLLLIPHMPSSEMIDYFTINNLDITLLTFPSSIG